MRLLIENMKMGVEKGNSVVPFDTKGHKSVCADVFKANKSVDKTF